MQMAQRRGCATGTLGAGGVVVGCGEEVGGGGSSATFQHIHSSTPADRELCTWPHDNAHTYTVAPFLSLPEFAAIFLLQKKQNTTLLDV